VETNIGFKRDDMTHSGAWSVWIKSVFILTGTVCFAGDGIYVGVGYGGRRMSSVDGKKWENVEQWSDKGADDSNNLMSIAYGKGRFVAVGGGGWSKETQAGHILLSNDGKDWRKTGDYPNRVNPVVFGAGQFVAGGPAKQLLSSLDGEKWVEGDRIVVPPEIPNYAVWFRNGAAGNGVFVFMGNAGKDQKKWWCLASNDGRSIKSISWEAPGSRGLAFGAGVFVAVNPDGIARSKDGEQWNFVESVPSDEFKGVIWTGQEFVLSGKTATYASVDGVSWRVFGKVSPGNLLYGDMRGFVATGWPGRMFSSADGQSWQQGEQPQPALGLNKVVFGMPEK